MAAILQRCGVIEFRYSENDKKRLNYRMARYVAEMELSIAGLYPVFTAKVKA